MNGIVIIDKPKGMTSHEVVQDVKKALGAEKAGHTGTLDPLATGVLPVCINEATKLSRFISAENKEYRATMLLGVKTDTYDVEGKVIADEKPLVGREEIEKAMRNLVGKRKQAPPSFSAVKYHGKPLYKWARQGIAVDSLPRSVEIFEMSLEKVDLPYVTFRVGCSKGTYIRSLCFELGEALGCGACLAALRRIKSGRYTEEKALSFAGIGKKEKREALAAHLIPMADALPDLAAIHVDDLLAEKMGQGYQPVIGSLLADHIPSLAKGDMVRFIAGGRLVAIAEALHPSAGWSILDRQEQAVKIIRVFNVD